MKLEIIQKFVKTSLTLSIIFLFSNRVIGQEARSEHYEMVLRKGWEMQSEMVVKEKGSQIASEKYMTDHWYKVQVPTTIIAGLLTNNEYNFDPFYGRNFEKLSHVKFDNPWWFRKVFVLPNTEAGKNIVLQLQGINYKANIWMNGKLVADSNQVRGPFRIIELNITKYVNYKSSNVLAIELERPFNPQQAGGDLAIDYADWIHYPPDYNGGIINDVVIKTFDKIGVSWPLVVTHFDLPSLSLAHLSAYAMVTNYSDKQEEAIIKGKINQQIYFQQKVILAPGEKKQISFLPEEYPQLNIKNPKIWWPWQYGSQEFNQIEFSSVVNQKLSNIVSDRFGIREVTSKLIDTVSREFYINGKPIMLRGAAWSPDIFQRRQEERQEQEVKLVRDMHMNIIRSEGKLEDDHFYDLCDRYGLLVMSGWMCCGSWQYPERWDIDKRNVAMSSDSSVMLWLRNKACMLVWLNGSDMPPRDTTVEKDYLTIEANLKWPNPLISTADGSKSKVSGFSGVKMKGPYDWVPPVYWESDSNKLGGAWSFATEISPGPSIPPYESLTRFIAEDSILYSHKDWLYHTGTGAFGTTEIFDTALNVRYGPSENMRKYVEKAQAQDYEGHRAMMEAYGVNKYHSATGVVQWMLSNPWPGLIWHTYDYFLYPAGTYFGIKKALEPLHVMYSYKLNKVEIINNYLRTFPDLKVKADIFSMNGTQLFTKTVKTRVEADSIMQCFSLSLPSENSNVYFLRLQLNNEKGKEESINWYWLSNKPDSMNWKTSRWYYTPQFSYADYTGLQKLPKTIVTMQSSTEKGKDSVTCNLKIKNNGKAVAFFVHIRALKDKGGKDILPVLFTDNYLLLAPGEERFIQCRFAEKDFSNNKDPYFEMTYWNK